MDDSDWDSGPEESLGPPGPTDNNRQQVPSTNFVNNEAAAAAARHVTAANMKIPGRSLPMPAGAYDPESGGDAGSRSTPPLRNEPSQRQGPKLEAEGNNHSHGSRALKVKVCKEDIS